MVTVANRKLSPKYDKAPDILWGSSARVVPAIGI